MPHPSRSYCPANGPLSTSETNRRLQQSTRDALLRGQPSIDAYFYALGQFQIRALRGSLYKSGRNLAKGPSQSGAQPAAANQCATHCCKPIAELQSPYLLSEPNSLSCLSTWMCICVFEAGSARCHFETLLHRHSPILEPHLIL